MFFSKKSLTSSRKGGKMYFVSCSHFANYLKGGKLLLQEKLVKIRKENGVNQSDLAKLLGISKNSYSLKEQGKTDFKISEMFKIANHFKKSISDIFTQ